VKSILEKIYNLIGIAQKAGKVSAGTLAAKNSLIRGKAALLVLSQDIAENTKESLVNSCKHKRIPYLILGSKYELGNCVGKAYRVAVTINDAGMAGAIINALQTGGDEANTLMGVVEWPK